MPRVDESYLREKFGAALHGLATGTGSLPERVRNAMVILVMFSPEDMPDKWSRENFAKLLYLTTDREPASNEGGLAATLDTMPIDEVQDLARMIVELEDHLLRRLEKDYAEGQDPA